MKFYFSTRLGENTGSGGKHGVWKRRGVVEKTGCSGKDGVWWKTWGLVENTGFRGKDRVWWKTRRVENTGSTWKTRGLLGRRYHFFGKT